MQGIFQKLQIIRAFFSWQATGLLIPHIGRCMLLRFSGKKNAWRPSTCWGRQPQYVSKCVCWSRHKREEGQKMGWQRERDKNCFHSSHKHTLILEAYRTWGNAKHAWHFPWHQVSRRLSTDARCSPSLSLIWLHKAVMLSYSEGTLVRLYNKLQESMHAFFAQYKDQTYISSFPKICFYFLL